MRIVELNTCDYGSTGNIMLQTANMARIAGNEVITFSPHKRTVTGDRSHHIYIGNSLDRFIHRVLCKFTGLNGCFSIISTFLFIKKLKRINPDIIHLHNLHNCYVNLPMLFHYIKKENKSVIWTLHDCWSFTGQCPHFQIAQCNKWKSGCYKCPQYKLYPASYVDNTKFMWKKKKSWFTGINNIILVTPSNWLSNLVKQSFLKDYPVKVINNGIDNKIFRPIKSDFRNRYTISQYMVLGVAFDWGRRKGLDVFIRLAEMLDSTYSIVLVGVNDDIIEMLPKNIIAIKKTQDQIALAEIYTAANVFVNPTREDNFPTVNIEAISCGTPVVTFKTGGSPESINDSCGVVVDCDDIMLLKDKIEWVCKEKPFTEAACIEHAGKYNINDRFMEYIELYESMYKD